MMGLMACVSKLTSKVVPSGLERVTYWVAIWLAAPGLFSTTTVRPSSSANLGWIIRDAISVLPPGGKGTTSLMGASSALAAAAMDRASRHEAPILRRAPLGFLCVKNRVIVFPLGCGGLHKLIKPCVE